MAFLDTLSEERIAELKEQFPARFPIAKENEMVDIWGVSWENMQLQELTCKNHPMIRFLSKNPYNRGLHMIQGPNGLPEMLDPMCECPFEDLRAVVREAKEK